MVNNDVDHYEVLGVASTADVAEIRRAWIGAARELHPDQRRSAANTRAGVDPDEGIRLVNEAWRILGDSDRRAAYDRDRSRARRTAAAAAEREARRGVDETSVGTPPSSGDTWQGIEVRSPIVAVVLRTLPWLLAAGLGVGIFVGTAVAGRPAQETEPTFGATPDCVRVAEDAIRNVPCQWDGATVVDQQLRAADSLVCEDDTATLAVVLPDGVVLVASSPETPAAHVLEAGASEVVCLISYERYMAGADAAAG